MALYATHSRLKILAQRGLKFINEYTYELQTDRLRFKEFKLVPVKGNIYKLEIPKLEVTREVWIVVANPKLFRLGKISAPVFLIPGEQDASIYIELFPGDNKTKPVFNKEEVSFALDLFSLTI